MVSRIAWHATRILGLGLILVSSAMLRGTAPPVGATAQTPAPTADTHPEFPQGPGRDITLKSCSQCHSPNNILAQGRSREGWEDIITKMVSFGATGTDEDFTSILDYLTKSFPATPGTSAATPGSAPSAIPSAGKAPPRTP